MMVGALTLGSSSDRFGRQPSDSRLPDAIRMGGARHRLQREYGCSLRSAVSSLASASAPWCERRRIDVGNVAEESPQHPVTIVLSVYSVGGVIAQR